MSTTTLVTKAETVEDRVAKGLVTVITNDGTNSPLPAFGPRQPVEMPKNRVEVRGINFMRATDQMNWTPDGKPFYNHRRGILSATVITQRHKDPDVAPDDKHGVMVGRVRWLCSTVSGLLTPAVMSSYQVVDVIDLGASYRADETTETERTEIRFQVDLLIPSANYSDT